MIKKGLMVSILILSLVALAAMPALGAIVSSQTLSTRVQFVKPGTDAMEFEIYADPNCISQLKSIEWGYISVSDNNCRKVIYLKHVGTQTIQIAGVQGGFGGSDPSHRVGYVESSDRFILRPGETHPLTLTLRLLPVPPRQGFDFLTTIHCVAKDVWEVFDME